MRPRDVTCPRCGRVEAPGARCTGCGYSVEEHVAAPAGPLVKRPTVKTRSKKNPVPQVVEQAPIHETREQWMLAAVEAFLPDLEAAGATVPRVRISVGWPGGRGNKQHVVGQCWMPEAVADGLPAIFVSPVQDKPVDVLETVLHELVHAAGHRGHRGGFAKLAGALGFIAPWKSTPAGPELTERLTVLAEQLGPWPHAKVRGEGGLLGTGPTAPPVQGTRMLKVMCEECGCVIRMTRKWLTEAGTPTCGCGGSMVEVEKL